MNNTKLLIFDLDGTIIDSENINYRAYKQALNEIGINLDKDFFKKECFNGQHYTYFLPLIIPNANNNLIEKIHNKKQEIYKRNLNNIEVHPFIKELIRNNKEKKIALATTAGRIAVESVLKIIGLDNNFDLILTGDDVENRKPHPEVFLKCMEYFSISPNETIIFEDSDIGLEAAYKTNAWIIKIERWCNN